MSKVNELIEALQIMAPYMKDESSPTGCGHDIMYFSADITNITPEEFARLEELGVFLDTEFVCMASFRFGSL